MAAPLLVLVACLAGIFTVDDDGPADFPDLTTAAGSPLVADGDTLLIEPGTYGGLTLTKGLHLVAADERGYRLGDLVVDRVPSFSLVGAEVTSLTLTDIPGTALVDRCRVFELSFVDGLDVHRSSHTTARRCADLVLQRSRFVGTDACYSGGPDYAEPAVILSGTDAVIASCILIGGEDEGLAGCGPHYPTAGEALRLEPGCEVVVSGSTLQAGGHWSTPQVPAIDVQGSHLIVRGSHRDLLFCHPGTPAVVVDPTSSAVVGGTSLVPHWLQPEVAAPATPEPFLAIEGAGALGELQHAELFGPRGSLAALLVGPALPLRRPDPTPAGTIPGPAPTGATWLDPSTPSAMVVLQLRGLRTPAQATWRLPADPALAGQALATQAWVTPVSTTGSPPTTAGPWVTNPILLRPRP